MLIQGVELFAQVHSNEIDHFSFFVGFFFHRDAAEQGGEKAQRVPAAERDAASVVLAPAPSLSRHGNINAGTLILPAADWKRGGSFTWDYIVL